MDLTGEAYFRSWGSRGEKDRGNVPVMMVGGIRTPALMADDDRKRMRLTLFPLCRPFIREPGIVNVWQKGDFRPATMYFLQ